MTKARKNGTEYECKTILRKLENDVRRIREQLSKKSFFS